MAVKNLEIIQVAIEQLEKREPEMIKSMLVQFVKTNIKKPSAKKINMFDYVATGEQAAIRPVLGGVYMDKENKVAVATDSFVIIISKTEYKPTRFKSGIVCRDGKSIDGKYVNYNYGLDIGKLTELKLFTKETIIDTARTTMAECKLEDLTFAMAIPIAKGTKFLFPVRRLPLLLEVGLSGWSYSESKGGYYYEDNDKKILIMGVKVSD